MDKETTAILRIQDAAEMSERLYQKPLLFTYSGGKDSDVLIHLAETAGIDFEVNHSLTTVDAPETVRHVKETFHRLENDGVHCTIDRHRQPDGKCKTMWNLIPHKGSPPTRIVRYCCHELKESGGKGRFVALGVRWAESYARSERQAFEVIHVKKEKRIGVMSMDNEEDRQAFESCPIKGERAVSPIIDWTDAEIWDYIRAEKIDLNPIYMQYNFTRVGCVGCPMAGKKQRYHEFAIWPKYQQNYIRAFDRMLAVRKAKNNEDMQWKSGEQVFHWWMQDDILPGQLSLLDDDTEENK